MDIRRLVHEETHESTHELMLFAPVSQALPVIATTTISTKVRTEHKIPSSMLGEMVTPIKRAWSFKA